jgi:hypothetical protein
MRGLMRAILFGGGWFVALLAIYLLVVVPEAAQLTDREPIVIAVTAITSALVLWTATRLPATPSWPTAIVGWIAGFFLPLGAVRVLLAIADQIFR